MKKISLLFLMLISISAFSQQKKFNNKVQKSNVELSSEERATLMSKKLALQLDLSEAQQLQVKELFTEQAEKRKAVMAERKKMSEEELRDKKANHYNRMNSRLENQLAYQEKMKDILNKDQYALFKEKQRKLKRTMFKKRFPKDRTE